MAGDWNTIESDAGVFTYLLDQLGVKDVQCEELLTLDPAELMKLAPVYGVIFLFKVPTDKPYRDPSGRPLDGDFDDEAAEVGGTLYFANQTIQNACATQALLSIILNKVIDTDTSEWGINVGHMLKSHHEFAMNLSPEMRGEVLTNDTSIRDVHNSFARANPFLDETDHIIDPNDEDAAAYHFIAYTRVHDTLYELDGLQLMPIRHGRLGECSSPERFAAKVVEVLQRRIARYSDTEIRFNLLAVVRDLRKHAEETEDVPTLISEQRKRVEWRFENALRQHNFIPFIGQLLRGVIAAKLAEGGEDAYQDWVDKAKEATKKRAEGQKKGGGGGAASGAGGDVEMQG